MQENGGSGPFLARFGVLHANRSLLLMSAIEKDEEEVLQFGVHAAWSLVVKEPRPRPAAGFWPYGLAFPIVFSWFSHGLRMF